eukprot:scaffold23007_cov60-Phaeocystis_antarctica.AAC.8
MGSYRRHRDAPRTLHARSRPDGSDPHLAPPAARLEALGGVEARAAERSRRVRHVCGRARPRCFMPAAGPHLAMLLQPLLRVLSPLAEAGGGGQLRRLELAQPALAVRVVVPRVEAPADGQPAECPAVALAWVDLAAVTALLRGADSVGEPPVQELAVTSGVRVLAARQLRRHRRAVPVVRVA